MAEKGELITAEDFTTLKKLVNNEISRRSANGSVGSISSYSGSNYQYTNTPAVGQKIEYEHIQKITKPLDAIDGSSLTPPQKSLIYAETIKNALAKINDLSSRSQTGSSTGCNASCTGLCSSGCYGGCSSCSGCSGCSGCGSCGGGCSGCSGCGWIVF